jgi:hypothetical protein
VKNVVHQIRRIFEMPHQAVHGETFYAGDRSINLLDWANGFSVELSGHKARVVPRAFLRGLALLGDIPTALTGKPFLINSSRYRSMITEYKTPMERTFKLLGENPYSLEEGIADTIAWLRTCESQSNFGGGS